MNQQPDTDAALLRVLFCIGVAQTFFEQEGVLVSELTDAITKAFDDLQGRFGLTVLGTLDDDQLMVGPSGSWPWTAYILAEAPNLESIAGVCDILRATPVGSHRLWRYLRIEARVGRRLFFGNS